MKVVSETPDELVLRNSGYIVVVIAAAFIAAGIFLLVFPNLTAARPPWWFAPLFLLAGLGAAYFGLKEFYTLSFSKPRDRISKSYALGFFGQAKEYALGAVEKVLAAEDMKMSSSKNGSRPLFGWRINLKLIDGTLVGLNNPTYKNGRPVPDGSGEVQLARKIGAFLGVPVEVFPLPAGGSFGLGGIQIRM